MNISRMQSNSSEVGNLIPQPLVAASSSSRQSQRITKKKQYIEDNQSVASTTNSTLVSTSISMRCGGMLSSRYVQNQKHQQCTKTKRGPKPTPCSFVRSLHRSYKQRLYQEQAQLLVHSCHSNNTSSYASGRHIMNGTNPSFTVVADPADMLYQEVQNFIKRYSSSVLLHDVVDIQTGRNLLHLVCSNPALVHHKKLMEILTKTTTHNEQKYQPSSHFHSSTKAIQLQEGRENFNDKILKDSSAFTVVPRQSLAHQQSLDGDTPLSLLCQHYATFYDHTIGQSTSKYMCGVKDQNAMLSSWVDVLEYLIQCSPQSVRLVNPCNNFQLPLHNLLQCMYSTSSRTTTAGAACRYTIPPPLNGVILLVQKYSESCSIPNGNGDLPLHLISRIIIDSNVAPRNRASLSSSAYNQCSSSPPYDQKSDDEVDSLSELDIDDDDEEDDDDMDDEELQISSQVLCHLQQQNNHSDNNKAGSDKNHCEWNRFQQQQQHQLHIKMQSQSETLNSNNNNDDVNIIERYSRQLEIIQYLVSIYPDALNKRNNMGCTPYEVAVMTSRRCYNNDSCNPDSDSKLLDLQRLDPTNSNEQISNSWNPILEFLKDPNSWNEKLISKSDVSNHNVYHPTILQQQLSQRLQQGQNKRKSDSHSGFVMDVSGHDHEAVLFRNQENVYSEGRLGLEPHAEATNTPWQRKNSLLDRYVDHLTMTKNTGNHNIGNSNHNDPVMSVLQVLDDTSERSTAQSFYRSSPVKSVFTTPLHNSKEKVLLRPPSSDLVDFDESITSFSSVEVVNSDGDDEGVTSEASVGIHDIDSISHYTDSTDNSDQISIGCQDGTYSSDDHSS